MKLLVLFIHLWSIYDRDICAAMFLITIGFICYGLLDAAAIVRASSQHAEEVSINRRKQ